MLLATLHKNMKFILVLALFAAVACCAHGSRVTQWGRITTRVARKIQVTAEPVANRVQRRDASFHGVNCYNLNSKKY